MSARGSFPKPRGEIEKLHGVPTVHREANAIAYLRRMLGSADLLDVETVNDVGHVTRWLLVPVGDAELDWLAAFGADTEDLEGADADIEDDGINEPNITAPNQVLHAASDDQRMTVRQWRNLPVHAAAD